MQQAGWMTEMKTAAICDTVDGWCRVLIARP